MKLSRLKQIIRETVKQLHEDDLEQWCMCGCTTGADDCIGNSLPNGECDCSCCDDIPVKDILPKKYRR